MVVGRDVQMSVAGFRIKWWKALVKLVYSKSPEGGSLELLFWESWQKQRGTTIGEQLL